MENHEEEPVDFEIDVNLLDRQDIARFLNEETLTFLSKLDDIWDVIGTELKERKRRGFIVIDSVKDLLGTMLEEAELQKDCLVKKISAQMQELSNLGKSLQINITDDMGSGYENMPLNTVYSNLQEKIKKYKDMHEALLLELNELKERDKKLCRILGKKEKYLPTTPIPIPEEINTFKHYLDDMTEEITKRKEIFLKAKTGIIDIMKELEIKASLEFEKNVFYNKESDFLLSDENMEQLDILYASLYRQQKDMHLKIDELREKISIYWERLEESPEVRSTFLNAYPGNNRKAYQALKKEELRCKDKIKANIKIFIDKMRNEIEKWWAHCHYSDKQKKEFIHFDSDCYNEDLLTLHEMYIEKLKNFFETNKGIFDLIAKRTKLWTRLLELEKKAVNPDRFKNRGGQLLREEKERNSVRAQLPKVEDQLLHLVEIFEIEKQKPFLISGQNVADMIQNDWEQFKENKHTQLSAKKQAREQVMRTPMKSPGSTKILATLSNNKTPRTPRSPSKRRLAMPLFGSSSAKKNRSLTKKMTVNASTLNKRVSLERRQRLEPKRHSRDSKNGTKTTNITDYDNFELGLDNKLACRSTLHIEQDSADNIAGPSCTPKIVIHTPSRYDLKSKTPANNNRLTPAPGNRPIII